MNADKVSAAQTFYEVIAIIITGIGITLEPAAFIGCLVFASTGSVVARGLDPMVASRRAFWLTMATGLLFALAMLLLNESLAEAKDWWPALPPQFLAIVGGLFGPIAIPLLLRRFPVLADRLLGRIAPGNASSSATSADPEAGKTVSKQKGA